MRFWDLDYNADCSGGASYRAKGLKPPPPVFAAAPPEFLCKVKSDTLLLFQAVKWKVKSPKRKIKKKTTITNNNIHRFNC